MATTQLDRLMWAQGNRCFFCEQPLPMNEASVEHLWAKANGGTKTDENCVACCKAVNALLGRMSLKEKFQAVLNQQGKFCCPNSRTTTGKATETARLKEAKQDSYALVVENLKQRGTHAPKTLKTLASTVNVLLGHSHKGASPDEVIEQMQARGVALVSGAKVTYDFTRSDIRPK